MRLAFNGVGGLPAGTAPAGRSGPAAPAPVLAPASSTVAADLPSTSASDTAPLPVALRTRLPLEPSFQAAVAGGQQALAYLQTLAAQLQGLKSDLSTRLAAGTPPDATLEARIDRLAVTWGNRQNDAGGSLDGQLAYTSPPQATQRFSVRGLSVSALQAGDKETISLALNAAGQRLVSVSTVPGLSANEIVERFAQALAPAGIQVSTDAADANGTLIFSVPEAGWPALRDSLQIKGNGVRFAAGQLVRVRADPEPEAVQPATWSASDANTMRLTLQHVLRAATRVQHAQSAASADLGAASTHLNALQPAADAAAAATAAQRFAALADRGGYEVSASLAAALSGVQRGRVVSLLALPVTPQTAA